MMIMKGIFCIQNNTYPPVLTIKKQGKEKLSFLRKNCFQKACIDWERHKGQLGKTPLLQDLCSA